MAATTAGSYVVAKLGVPTRLIRMGTSSIGTPAETAATGTNLAVHLATELVDIAR